MDKEEAAAPALAVVPPVDAPTRLGPKAQPEPIPEAYAKATEEAKLKRRLTDVIKAGMIDALKKASAQIAHSTDLNFTGIRSTSVQRHPDGQDLVVVVDVVPNVFHDGPLSR